MPKVSRVLIFTSPNAGSGAGREQLPRVEQELVRHGIDVATTCSIDQLREFARHESDPGNQVVIAAGGDGTLALVAQNVPREMPIVPMPLGTENLLARHFGFSRDAKQVAATVRDGKPFWLDAGLANGKMFLVMATCGFDAEVVRAVDLNRQGHISRLSYARPIVRAIRKYRFPPMTVRFTDPQQTAIHSCWVMAFNLPKYAGFLDIQPDADGQDGVLDMIGFQKGSFLSGLRYVAGIVLRRHRKFKDVIQRQAASFTITSDQRVAYQLDGDYGGHLPLKIETLPQQVKLLLPPE